MDLTQVLEATASPDTQLITQAQQQLEQAAQTNLPAFLTALANELSNVGKSDVARMAAGLQLKNCLTSKAVEVKVHLQQRWLSMELTVRQHIKIAVFNTLGTEPAHHRSAAQCVAYIAAAELPAGQWPEIICNLLRNVSGTSNTEAVKEASLEAIGYICEELDPNVLAVQANEILTAIIQGMRKEEPSNRVRLAATRALLNSLEFTKANFEKENERHFIMQVVCEATQCSDNNVQVAALQNLVKIMSLYYQYMEAYMGPALFAITLNAMKADHDQIALQGIEFWSTVCDEEADLSIEAMEAADAGRPPEQTSRFYVKGALEYLVPILLLTLAKQEEYDDEDDWNPCKAAGVCLSLMASCCENDIVPRVLPFVDQHLQNVDWKFRDAAVMALGSIIEGPEASPMEGFVHQKMETLISLMSDPAVQVQDTAAWTLGRVCDQLPEAALHESCREALLNCLAAGLEKEPRVATNVCWAFSSLAESAYELACTDEDTEPVTYSLSSAFEFLVSKVMQTADRPDASHNNLRTSAYEALMDLIKYSAKDCYVVIQKTTQVMMDRLRQILAVDAGGQVSGADKQQLADLESLICATLQSLVRKVSREDALTISSSVMEALLLMFQTSAAGSSSGVLEDALMTVGVLVEVLGENFQHYMEVFFPFLKLALQNYAAYQVCQAAVGLVGDLCRTLTAKMLPYCNDIMEIMVANLSNAAVHRTIKPQILSTIGDVALSIGSDFKVYLTIVFQILKEAAQLNVTINKNDFEMVDYINELREGCLEAYTGIVQGLKGEEGSTSGEPLPLLTLGAHTLIV
jgi:importin subunit beta-1